ncbi:DNA repair protein XRCC4 [Dunckerocampus dactyliophorus]|uniref:DNA repair protein XRCC4 n=1 Tax=Dunckerocampus dactyliophorus TaxID=161453 RepID=UPI00240580CF|nr:DNA repair protein XRCC4 [Dunckerocampus dactyliophorus]
MQSSVQEIHVSSQADTSYFLRVDWSGRGLASGFHLMLTDGQDAWRGEVNEGMMCQEAAELEMPEDGYIQDLQQALTEKESSGSYRFTLSPSPPSQSAALTLAYDKVLKDISFRLGSVLLSPVPEPAEAVKRLLTHSLERGSALEHQNQELEEQNRRLRQEHQRITAELKRYADGKADLEAELYSRFVLVLNEKKAKIRSLQETVKELQEVRTAEQKKDPLKRDRAETQEEDEYGGSTDDEQEDRRPTPAAIAPSCEGQSSSPSPLDDTLSDITDVAPCRKRRFRHLVASDAATRPPPQTLSSQKTSRKDSPAAANQQPVPSQRRSDVSAAAEDLFEDF